MTSSSLLEFSLLKVVEKIGKKGIDMKKVFESWDDDKNGYRKCAQVIYPLCCCVSRFK